MHDQPKNAIAVFSLFDPDRQSSMREFAMSQGFHLVGFLAIEPDFSFSGFKQAFAMCKSESASVIIVDELESFSLPKKGLGELFSLFVEADLAILFAKEKLTLHGELLQAFIKIHAQSERVDNEIRSAKIKKSLKEKRRKGIALGGKKFGSEKDEFFVVKQIIRLRKDGKSLQEICELLTKNQIKTIQKKSWHPTTVKRILERHGG